MTEQTLNAIGFQGLWGMSASIDLLEHCADPTNSSEPLNVLLLAPGDVRHMLTTISRRKRHQSSRPIHLYIFEPNAEALCRELLLLQVSLEWEIPVRQRANIFLEIFGNCKVQERTSRYIELLGHKLRTLVVDGKGQLAEVVDLSLLKYRDKDAMEEVFKGYARSVPFDMDGLFEHRVRGHLGDRYDARVAMADWDWHSSILKSASIIHVRMYKDWRRAGVAFEFGDQSYTEPNRTMMSYQQGVMKKGRDAGLKKEIRGYWGDIVCSPYFSFGVDCDTPNKLAEGLFEIINKDTGTEQHRHNCVEIAVYSVISQLWEIETGRVYAMLKKNDVFSGLGIGDVRPEEEHRVEELLDGEEEGVAAAKSSAEDELPTHDSEKEQCVGEAWGGVKVVPLTGQAQGTLGKERFLRFFDIVYVSSRYAQLLAEPLIDDILKEGGTVAVESSKFIVPLTAEQKELFEQKVLEYSAARGWKAKSVRRRRRDERDSRDDVLFFKKNDS